MKIPEIAKRIKEIANEIRGDHGELADEMLDLAIEMRRRQTGKRAPSRSTPMTEELAKEIRAYARRHPDVSQQEIGQKFNVNHGRVSETLSGHRT